MKAFKSLIILILFSCGSNTTPAEMQNFIFFNRDRSRIKETSFLETEQIAGAQLKYTWPELEPEKDRYNFDLIQRDLDFLKAKGKKLFIQIQDVSFDTSIVNVPRYMREDPVYNGGVAIQRDLNKEGTEYVIEGLVARRWNKHVAERFHILLKKLGERFDGRLAGVNLPESSVGLGTPAMHPPGFTYEKYRDAIKDNMRVLKSSFPNTDVIQYANFMPGEWLPDDDHHYLRDLYDYAVKIGAGMGGPDIKVYKRAQMNHSYKMIRNCAGRIPTGVAVQWGNYDLVNPKTGKQVTIPEIYRFAKDYLQLRYIFWSTQEPYYTENVLPFLNNLER